MKDGENYKDLANAETPQVYAVEIAGAKRHFTRRDFLKAAGVVGAAAGLTGCGSDKELTSGPLPTQIPVIELADVAPLDERESSACEDLIAHTEVINKIVISPDGTLLASASKDGTVKLWSIRGGALLKTMPLTTTYISQLAFSPDGSYLVASERGGIVNWWRMPDGELEKTIEIDEYALSQMSISPYGDLLAIATTGRKIHLFSFPDGEPRAVLGSGVSGFLQKHGDNITEMFFTPDGLQLATSSDDEKVKLWSIAEEKLFKTLDEHTSWVRGLAVTPDGKLLISGSTDRTIRFWSLPDGELVKGLLSGPEDYYRSGDFDVLAVSSDNKWLAAGSFYMRSIYIFSLPDGELKATIEKDEITEGTRQLLISAKHQLLISITKNSGKIKLWSLPDGELVSTLVGHTDDVTSIALNPTEDILASGSEDTTIKLWSIADRALVACPYDLEVTFSNIRRIVYEETNDAGETFTYTLSCGSPIPPGAVCTCNCVSGGSVPPCSCVGHSGSGGSHYWYPN